MKKSIATILITCMVVSSLSACSSNTESTSTSSTTITTSTETAVPTELNEPSIFTESGYPIVNEGNQIVISAFAPFRDPISSYDASDNAFTQWLEETTGLTFKFTTSLEIDAKQKLNTIMVGGDLPDIFLYSPNYPLSASEQLLYGSQGILIPLNDLIEKYAPNLQAAFEEYPHIKDAMTMTDGNIYSMPTMGKSTHTLHPYKMWLNGEWLDNLGLKTPQTTEDFYQVLKAFKEQDANGNGDPNDEIPLSGHPDGWNTDPTVFLMNAFVTYNPSNDTKGMYLEDGVIKYSKVQDGWKEGIKYLNRLYEDGLLDPLLFTQSLDSLKSIGSPSGDTILGSYPCGSATGVCSVDSNGRWANYLAISPLEGPNGFREAVTTLDYGKSGLNITYECEYPEAVVRAFDLLYTRDAVLANKFGVKGIDYIDAEDGELNYIGEPASVKQLTRTTDKENRAWNALGPWSVSSDWDLGYVANGDIEQVLYVSTIENYIPYAGNTDTLLPPLALNEEDSRVIVDVEVPLNQYINQITVEFITGVKDIDAEWDTYLKNVESFGLSKYLEVYQRNFDAKFK